MAGSDDELFGAEHVRVYRETGGERGYHWRGTTILLLTTKGRASGEPRTTPLIHRTDGERWVVVASKGGAPEHPVWYYNLLADPEAVAVQDGPEPFEVSVREATGDEKREWWDRAVAAYPPYAEYQAKTDRQIPLFIATPKGR